MIYYVNGLNERISNWMRFVNCSRVESEQNLIAYQYDGEIFYKAYKQINIGDELLVWYGEKYASEELNIQLGDDEQQDDTTTQQQGNGMILLYYILLSRSWKYLI